MSNFSNEHKPTMWWLICCSHPSSASCGYRSSNRVTPELSGISFFFWYQRARHRARLSEGDFAAPFGASVQSNIASDALRGECRGLRQTRSPCSTTRHYPNRGNELSVPPA